MLGLAATSSTVDPSSVELEEIKEKGEAEGKAKGSTPRRPAPNPERREALRRAKCLSDQ